MAGADEAAYHAGFGNWVRSEALPGALPLGQNSPQRPPYGLYTEVLSGSAFTRPRHLNQRSWLYRIRPSVQHRPFRPRAHPHLVGDFGAGAAAGAAADPNQTRWMPLPIPAEPTDWVDGLRTAGGAGDPAAGRGYAVHMYAATAPMRDRCLNNADGDFLIVPQQGALDVRTEFGVMRVEPREICVVQRGMRFSVSVSGPSRGYVLEVYARHFSLPDLGPIGSSGLANPQDFLHPSAAYEDREGVAYTVLNKFGGALFSAEQSHSPFNVVAFQGNYVPYKYDLSKFCCVHSVTYDHPDPSIYTVLTCQSDEPGVALADFVVFPPRWMVAEHTFRPPWYHRNVMSEYMGLIWGSYDAKGGDAKKASAFLPGGASLHSPTTPHGPDAGTHAGASAAALEPQFFDKGMAFMFETSMSMRLTPWASGAKHIDPDYWRCWQDLPRNFDPSARPASRAATLLQWREEARAKL